MKKFYTLLLIGIITSTFAQIPSNYYNSATSTGYTLKTQLYNIIKGHNNQGYAGLYTTYISSDRDYYYENDGTLLDMYSEKPNGPDSYTYSATSQGDRCGNYSDEGDCYNREHIIPQSVFGSASPMYADAHFVVPSDGYVNGIRGNYAFGRVGTVDRITSNGSKRGYNLNSGYSAGYSGMVFEPIDEFKGDIARMIFYFATRYENNVGNYTYSMFNGTSNQVFTPHAINVLLTWANQDPVSQREIDRNNAVYSRQSNRNPFIDHPEYAMAIWGSLLNTDSYTAIQDVSIYPNPSNDNRVHIYSETEITNIQVVTISGQIIREISNPDFAENTFTLNDLPSGFYFVRLSNQTAETVKKLIVN